MSAFVDTNILIRHLTGDPSDMAARATAFLRSARELLLPDVIVAETIYVLESYYELARQGVADAMRASLAMDSIVCIDKPLLHRAIEVYETARLDFAEAYLVACAEISAVGRIASFDRSVDRIGTVVRIEPPR